MKYKNVTKKTINVKDNGDWVTARAGKVVELSFLPEGFEEVKIKKEIKIVEVKKETVGINKILTKEVIDKVKKEYEEIVEEPKVKKEKAPIKKKQFLSKKK